MRAAYGDATAQIFMVSAIVGVVALIAILFIKEEPLRRTVDIAGPAAGSATSDGGPVTGAAASDAGPAAGAAASDAGPATGAAASDGGRASGACDEKYAVWMIFGLRCSTRAGRFVELDGYGCRPPLLLLGASG